jgi:C1A family cysteine protease
MLRNHPGGRRDAPDDRDVPFLPALHAAALPDRVDLRASCGAVYNQLDIKSCSANAVAALMVFLGNVERRPIEPPSRLFIYYNERKLEGTLPGDDGAAIRSAMKCVVKQGACAETQWPYDPAMVSTEPPAPCYESAKSCRAFAYSRIAQNLDHMRGCLAEGYAFAFGMQAYMQGFEAAKTSGLIPMPGSNDTLVGGHAVLAVGYDNATQTILALNSIGTGWGQSGYFTLPYAYITNTTLAYDCWTIRSVT